MSELPGAQISLQEKFAPHSTCFGCGPANPKGLKIKSIAVSDTESTASWQPQDFHEAFPGMLNGGIIGSLLDCHSNWLAAWHLMKKNSLERPPCTVTADYAVKLLRPTPSKEVVKLVARIDSSEENRATVEAEMKSGDKVCATCRGTFVAVTEGHPAYHRW